MKNLLFVILLVLCSSVYSQNIKGRTVLDYFILGVDSIESIQEKIDFPEYNVYECIYPDGVNGTRIMYDLPNLVRINILLLNDTLYAIQYYPYYYNIADELNNIKDDWSKGLLSKSRLEKLISKTEKSGKKTEELVSKYKNYLNIKYNAYDTNSHWFNSDVEIYYDVDGNEMKSFIHYDYKMMKKYHKYKDIL